MATFSEYLDWLVESAQAVGGSAPVKKRTRPLHPGEVLQRDYLVKFGLSQSELARRIGCSHAKINEVIHGRRNVSPKMALALGKALGTPASLWLSLQGEYDLWRVKQKS